MADQSEVDRVLGQYPAQDLDAVTNALPPVPPERPFPENLAHMPRGELFGRAHTWLTRNVLEPAQYAMMYPPRVVSRMYPDWPVPAHEQPGRAGLRRRMGEGDKHGGPLPVNEIDAMGTYTPGERQSDMVEDRRPKSPWEYADGGEVDRILSQYGQGYTSPALNSGDGEIASTPDILAQYTRRNEGLPGVLRGWAGNVRDASRPDNVLAGGLDTAANWVAGDPEIGRDTLAPLGLGVMGSMFAVPGAAGIFGGRLARTADREALSRAEEMAGRGASRDDIWNQTGWFQGVDGKWRFEIDDSRSALTAPTQRLYETEGVRQSVLPNVLEHETLYQAYPDLAYTGVTARAAREGPHGGSYAHDVDRMEAAAPNAPEARSTLLHETQHGIQNREDYARGAELFDFQNPYSPVYHHRRPDESARDAYRRVQGEVESRNVQTRQDFTPDERRARPPWETQDVPDADQILRQYSSGPQMSAPTERPVSAAIRYRGEVFTGAHHADAVAEAVKKYGQQAQDDLWASTNPHDTNGFVTSTGRYLTRDEAHKLMQQRGYSDHDMANPMYTRNFDE